MAFLNLSLRRSCYEAMTKTLMNNVSSCQLGHPLVWRSSNKLSAEGKKFLPFSQESKLSDKVSLMPYELY